MFLGAAKTGRSHFMVRLAFLSQCGFSNEFQTGKFGSSRAFGDWCYSPTISPLVSATDQVLPKQFI